MGESANRRRVCFVANGQTPHGVTRAEALAACGVEVRFITIGPVMTTSLDVRSTPLPRGPLGAASAFRAFFREIRAFRPDLLHLHYAGGRLGTLAHLAAVHPFVVSVIGGDVLGEQHEGGWSAAEERATALILNDADLVLAKSERLRARVLEFGPYAPKTEVVRWGVDSGFFKRDEAGRARVRARFGRSAKDVVVLSPRSLQPLYNIDLIVDAFARAAQKRKDLFLALTETGVSPPYLASIRAQAAALGIADRIQFWGRFERAELPSLYSAADLVVSVPRSDGLPQSLFEAMACETPTILGDLETYRELAAPGEGVFYSPIHAEAVARLLLEGSVEDWKAAGGRGRRRILEIADLHAEARRVKDFYERALEAPRRVRRASLVEALSLLPRSL